MSKESLSSKFKIDPELENEDIQEALKSHRFIELEHFEDFINKYK
jgi:hypothetical protein